MGGAASCSAGSPVSREDGALAHRPVSTAEQLSEGKRPLCPQIDLQKMPLGKLSKRQIQAAYSILGEVQQVGRASQASAPRLATSHAAAHGA